MRALFMNQEWICNQLILDRVLVPSSNIDINYIAVGAFFTFPLGGNWGTFFGKQ